MGQTHEPKRPYGPESTPDLVVPAPSAPKPRQLWPAASLIVLALGLLGYRLSVADWHWEWPWEHAAASAPEAAIAEKVESARPGDPVALARAPDAVPSNELVGPPRLEALADDEPADAAEKADGAALALSDIEKEAERIRKDREELEKAKEEAGKEIAAAPRRPAFGAFPNGALLAQRQMAMERLMRQQMLEHRRAMERMLRQERRFANRGRMNPQMGAEFDRMFEAMRRDMQAFEREAEALMRDQRAMAFGGNMGAGRIVIPPMPGLDVPAPPEPGMEEDPADAAGTPNGDQPRVRRRTFVTPDGMRVETMEIRRGFGGH